MFPCVCKHCVLLNFVFSVAAKCDKNLMTTSNLGVCFGPTLLRPEEETVAAIVDLKFYNIVVEILIDNHRTIFTTEPAKDDTQISPSKQLHVQQNKKVNDYQNTMFYDYNNLMKSGQHYPQQSREQLVNITKTYKKIKSFERFLFLYRLYGPIVIPHQQIFHPACTTYMNHHQCPTTVYIQ